MKKLLYRILGLDRQLKAAYEAGITAGVARVKEREAIKNQINYPVDTVWIVRSNHAGPLVLAKVVDHVFMHDQLETLFEDFQGNRFFTGGALSFYTPERLNSLMKLDWWDQWNVMTHFAHTLSPQTAALAEFEVKQVPCEA